MFKFFKTTIKRFLLAMFILFILLGITIFSCHFWVELQTQASLYSDIDAIPAKKVALLLGTVKRLRHGYINRYFQYRIDAAVQLYKAGKVKHILASGANHTRYYNEPRDMQKALMAQGVPKQAITLDYARIKPKRATSRVSPLSVVTLIPIIPSTMKNRESPDSL
jgi:SanA protein